jgi:murein DD-endopeptidase MepM/ murein hydrolase activator NlpD
VLKNPFADRCEPYQHDVVAAHDGIVHRNPPSYVVHETAFIVANTASENVRFRYMHMDPKHMDADGLVSGRRVRAGEVIGKVGNFYKKEGGTSYHLHFDTQVFTRDGWVWVNPYMTLVAAYERLIGARGKELDKELDSEPVAMPAITPMQGVPSDIIEQHTSAKPKSAKSKKAKRHKTKKPSKKRHRRHR